LIIFVRSTSVSVERVAQINANEIAVRAAAHSTSPTGCILVVGDVIGVEATFSRVMDIAIVGYEIADD